MTSSTLAEQISTDIVLGNIFESLGRPPLIFLDIRPLNYPMAIVADHEVAEQVSRATKAFPYSLPKSPMMTYIDPLIGHHSLVSIHVRVVFGLGGPDTRSSFPFIFG